MINLIVCHHFASYERVNNQNYLLKVNGNAFEYSGWKNSHKKVLLSIIILNAVLYSRNSPVVREGSKKLNSEFIRRKPKIVLILFFKSRMNILRGHLFFT